VKNDGLFDGENSLQANEEWPPDLATFTIATIEPNGESITVRAAYFRRARA